MKNCYCKTFVLTFLGLLSALVLRAQTSGVNLFSVAEGLDDGVNIWDTHYRDDGTVAYWGVGNVLRLTATRNVDGKPERMVINIWDKGDDDWELFQEKKNTYAEDGRLKEEQVWQHKRITRDDDYPKLLMQSLHHLDAATGKDSIVTSLCALNSEQGVIYDTLVVVKYLNKRDLPDSTITYKVYNNKSFLLSKEYTSYKKNRITQVVSNGYLWMTEEPIWYASGYIHNTSAENPEDHFEVSRHYMNVEYSSRGRVYSYIFGDERNKPYMERRVGIDSKDRITAVDISLADTISVLHARYTYDDQHRTTIHKVMGMEGLVNMAELGNMEMLLGKENIRYELTYTDDGTEQIAYYLRDKETGEFRNERTFCLAYTPSGKVAFSQIDSYYNGSLNDKEKNVYSYNEKEELILKLCYDWNQEDGWWLSAKDVYAYDERGNRTMEQSYYTSDDGETWQGRDNVERTFNADGKVLLEQEYDWEDSGWVNEKKTLWTYSRSGKITSEQRSSYSSDDKEWSQNDYYTISYDENDSIQVRTEYEWKYIGPSDSYARGKAVWTPQSEWTPLSAREYSYLPNGKQEAFFQWEEGVKVPTDMIEMLTVTGLTDVPDPHREYKQKTWHEWDCEKRKWVPQRRRLVSEGKQGYTEYWRVYDAQTGEWKEDRD